MFIEEDGMSEETQDNFDSLSDSLGDTLSVGPAPPIADSEGLRVRAGGMDVMGSGTIIHNLYAPLEFALPSNPPLNCRIIFRKDYDDRSARIKHELEGDTTVVLTLINMGTRMGSGPRNPVQVATVRRRPVSIQFVLRVLNEANGIGIFEYTWFVGADTEAGTWAPLDTSVTGAQQDPSETAEVDLTESVRADREAAARHTSEADLAEEARKVIDASDTNYGEDAIDGADTVMGADALTDDESATTDAVSSKQSGQ